MSNADDYIFARLIARSIVGVLVTLIGSCTYCSVNPHGAHYPCGREHVADVCPK